MGYEAMNERLTKGLQAWLVIALACLTWLLGGSFKQAMRDGAAWIWPPTEADMVEAETARVESETERLMRALEPEHDPDYLVARRFLGGEMSCDISALGPAVAGRIITIKVQGLDHRSWTDQKLRAVINGQRPEVFDLPVRVHDDEWTEEHVLAM